MISCPLSSVATEIRHSPASGVRPVLSPWTTTPGMFSSLFRS